MHITMQMQIFRFLLVKSDLNYGLAQWSPASRKDLNKLMSLLRVAAFFGRFVQELPF